MRPNSARDDSNSIDKPIMELSIVIPVLNEEESIGSLIEEIYVIWKMGELPKLTELIVVDDGSRDGTLVEIQKATARCAGLIVRVLKHVRTFGQTQALARGFQQSLGEFVVAMDGDGQNDPADIRTLLDKQRETEVDCVSGWRAKRDGDNSVRVGFSRVANLILSKAGDVAIHDSGCTLKAYRGDVIRRVPLYGDMHRIIPFQIEALGGSLAEEIVNHRARTGGKSKYSLRRTARVLQDIIVIFFFKRFILRPMHLLGSIGSAVFSVGAIGLITAVSMKVLGIFDFVETPILLLSLVLLIGGLNIISTGLLAEMTNRQSHAKNSLPYPYGWMEVTSQPK